MQRTREAANELALRTLSNNRRTILELRRGDLQRVLPACDLRSDAFMLGAKGSLQIVVYNDIPKLQAGCERARDGDNPTRTWRRTPG
jgi:hypothetical protein